MNADETLRVLSTRMRQDAETIGIDIRHPGHVLRNHANDVDRLAEKLARGLGPGLLINDGPIYTADLESLTKRLREVRDASITATEKEACERCIRATQAFFGGVQ